MRKIKKARIEIEVDRDVGIRDCAGVVKHSLERKRAPRM